MSQDTSLVENQTQLVHLRYQQPSELHANHLHLFSHLERDEIQFHASVSQPVAFREAMASLAAIVSSDYRYVPKDRTAYAAFMQMRRSHQNQGLAKAYRAYFEWLWNNDPLAWLILDPVISVHPDRLNIEVFSKDEGSYAMLSFEHTFFDVKQPPQYGTTNIDFSSELSQAIEQIRSFHPSEFSIGQQAVSVNVTTADALVDKEVVEKRIQVPKSWIRGFLQVQSASQIANDTFYLQAIDLYNVLHYLRLHADTKGKKRGLRIELVPNEAPRLVLEPDDVVIQGSDAPYQGKQAKVIRLWGRRRLALLKRFLPYTEQIEVRVLGNGMPSFWILRGKGLCLSLAITGFTASNWSQALNFDLLLPRQTEAVDELTQTVAYLKQVYCADFNSIKKATKLTSTTCQAALQQASQQGLVIYDVAAQVYRYRPLTQEALDMTHFQFRLPAEKLAYDLLARQKALGELTVALIPHEGLEITSTIKVQEDKRDYLSRLKLNEEGHVAKADCSCHQIMQHGLIHGPCSHLIALRMAYAAQLAQRDTQQLTQETKVFLRRKKGEADQILLTLNQKHLLMQREHKKCQQQQQWVYNSLPEARQAYLGKIAQLELSGFIEG